MNICSLSKISLVAACMVVAAGVVKPAKAFGLQTGTLPVIVHSSSALHASSLLKVHDSGNLPVIINPNPASVQGDGGNGNFGRGDNNYTLTIVLNYPTTKDQPVEITSQHRNLIDVPDDVVVPAGSQQVTVNFSVPYSHGRHHRDVRVFATCNGSTVETTIHVHYHDEND